MKCPVCNQSLKSKESQYGSNGAYECNNFQEELIHNFQYDNDGNHNRFIIILPGICLECSYYHWEIRIFNEYQELQEIKIAQGEEKLTPEEAYQLLNRYQKLIAFS
jgi:C4-type Zn-finger protein